RSRRSTTPFSSFPAMSTFVSSPCRVRRLPSEVFLSGHLLAPLRTARMDSVWKAGRQRALARELPQPPVDLAIHIPSTVSVHCRPRPVRGVHYMPEAFQAWRAIVLHASSCYDRRRRAWVRIPTQSLSAVEVVRKAGPRAERPVWLLSPRPSAVLSRGEQRSP